MSRRTYVDATRSGMLLGLVMIASFLIAGRGLGASGAFAAVAEKLSHFIGLDTTGSAALADRFPADGNLTDSWIVWQIVGVVVGAAVSSRVAKYFGRPVSVDETSSTRESAGGTPRMARALAGGALMGMGARLAYGCTSGLALSGGALLATGAWMFIPIAFASAFVMSYMLRRRVQAG